MGNLIISFRVVYIMVVLSNVSNPVFSSPFIPLNQ